MLTAGLGGMGGAQPLAATMTGATMLAVEVDATAAIGAGVAVGPFSTIGAGVIWLVFGDVPTNKCQQIRTASDSCSAGVRAFPDRRC